MPLPLRTGGGVSRGQMKEGTTARASERAELHRYRMFEKTATQTDRRMEEGEGVERVTLQWASAAVVKRGQAENGRRKKLSPAADCRPSVGRSVSRIHRKLPGCLAPSVGRIVGVECSMYTSRQLGNLGSGPARQRQKEEEESGWNGGHIF